MSKSAALKSRPSSTRSEKAGSAEKEPLLHPEESLEQAGKKMRDLKAETLPVVEGQRLVGSVDQPDPDRRAAGFGHDPHSTKVSDIMNGEVAYCYESDDFATALRRMDDGKLDRLPVVNREMRVVGVVTRADLTRRGADSKVS